MHLLAAEGDGVGREVRRPGCRRRHGDARVAEAELEGAPHLLELRRAWARARAPRSRSPHAPAPRRPADSARPPRARASARRRASRQTAADRGGRVAPPPGAPPRTQAPGDDLPLLVETRLCRSKMKPSWAPTAFTNAIQQELPRRVASMSSCSAPLPEMERRGRDVGDDVCAGEGEVGSGRPGLPDVFADRRPISVSPQRRGRARVRAWN